MPPSAENAPPPRRIIAFICMNPRCDRSFSNLYSYDQHRVHARNANTLCASLTMRREIIATRRAGVTTSVVTEIASKGVHRMLAHDWQDGRTSTLTKKLEVHGQTPTRNCLILKN